MFQLNWLTAAHCDDDLKPVVIGQALRWENTAGHDLAIAFQRDTFSSQSHLFDEGGNCNIGWKLAKFAIDVNGDHFAHIVRVRIRAAFYYRRV